jgi:hypothetical protein
VKRERLERHVDLKAVREILANIYQLLRIEDYPDENPRSWQKWRKMANVGVIALMSSKSSYWSAMAERWKASNTFIYSR